MIRVPKERLKFLGRSAVPAGLPIVRQILGDESPGYCQMSFGTKTLGDLLISAGVNRLLSY